MVVSINGQRLYLWRAVDSEGEVLDMLVQRGRDKAAAMKLLRKLLKRNALPPHLIVTDKLRSYGAALRELGFTGRHDQGLLGRCHVNGIRFQTQSVSFWGIVTFSIT
jgi:transposase-like protein